MSKRQNLREFQQRILNRLQDKNLSASRASTLGVRIAGQHWLINMVDIGEMLPIPKLTIVPLTKPWFRGVANVRGNLYGVVDMSSYQGKGRCQEDKSSYMLLVSEKLGFNTALLVERVLGLRDARNWTFDANQDQYVDEQGISWRKLDVVALLKQEEFLQIGS
jgi:twitching motility protein PilI